MNFLPFPLNLVFGFIGKNWKWFALAAVLIGAGLFVKAHFDGDARTAKALVAMTKDRDRYRSAYLAWKGYGEGEKRAYDAQAKLRGQEAQQAIQSLSAAQKSCSVRVAEARRSALAIKELLDAPQKPGSASRLFDPGSLSDALGIGRADSAPGSR